MKRFKEVITNIYSIPELRKRILFTIGMLCVFRLGCYIPLVGVNTKFLKSAMEDVEGGFGRVFGFLSIFSGGAFTQMSIFALGIMPYISASIIFQLLVKVIPKLEAIAKEGPSGHRKIAQWTRLATLPICFVQGLAIIAFLAGNNKIVPDAGFFSFTLPAICALMAGTMFVMWLGEKISEHGIGNGASVIILAGIIARLPNAVHIIATERDVYGMQKIILLVSIYVAVVIGIVITTQAQRRIPVQYARHTRGRMTFGGQRHYLPLRVNQAGVMPVIFASSLMALPVILAKVLGFDEMSEAFSRGHIGFWYTMLYVVMVIFFSYFWTALFFQPKEMSEQLKEYGSFVPGIRPGKETANYLEYIMNHITLVGAVFLCVVALLPDYVADMTGTSRAVSGFLGGTGILIVVGVCLDMLQKVESHLIMRNYDGLIQGGRIRGRR